MTNAEPEHGPWTRWHRVSETRWVRVRHYDAKAPGGVVLFETSNPTNWRSPGDDEEDLELSGSVRFDGCANFSNPGAALHVCGPDEAQEIAACVAAVYGIAESIGLDFDPCVGDIPPLVEWQDPNAKHPEAIEA